MNDQEQQTIAPKETIISRLNKNNQKLATYIYVVFSLVTISFFGIFALLPAFSTITSLRKQYDDNKKVYEALNQKLDALSRLDQEYKTLEQSLPYVYNAIPSSAQVPTFTRQIETIARKTNVQLETFPTGLVESFPLEDNGTGLYSFSFSLEASGNENDVNTFINEVISFNRIVSIDRITSGKSQGNTFKTSLGGKVFFSKDLAG